MLKVAIIEDEVPAIHRLTSMISNYHIDVEIEVVARTGKEAITLCMEKRPQLIFLDIHLPDMKGFQVIEALDYSPYVIFTTAYANYAIRAFQTWAVDYLLKPFDQDQLDQAINKYISIVAHDKVSKDVDWKDLAKLFDGEKNRSSFTFKNGDRIRLIDYTDIAYISAEDKYTKIYTIDGKTLFCDYSLKEIELNLNQSFLRIHRSTIINIATVSETRKTFKGRFIFFFNSDKVGTVRSGASYKNEIIAMLEL
jgi:two-component system LytT family response regulator